MTEEPTRKLAILMHADVVGSTALVQRNEALAHQRIQDTFRRFSGTITTHGGTTHEIRGDALVAEFPKTSDAVAAAIEFQADNEAHNSDLSDDVRPAVRVGIAMGEVIIADHTVTGEGIIMAQRLEQLAEPGGICLQGAAYDTVPKRLPFTYRNLGEYELKGFIEPVRVYAVGKSTDSTSSDSVTISGAASSVLADLPDKPSIAVLPFTNSSGDSEQEYFSDGITEDIITELSRYSTLFVIAQHSSFKFRGSSTERYSIGSDLGVRYIVEGSVRRASNRIRVTAQLVDVMNDRQVWAERFDREMDDIFALQDEIVSRVVSTTAGRIDAFEIEHSRRKPTENVSAYEFYLRGQRHFNTDYPFKDMATYERALNAYKSSLAIDPDYADAHAGLAMIQITGYTQGLLDSELGVKSAESALAFDSDNVRAHMALAYACHMSGQFSRSERHFRKALELNPNDVQTIGLWSYFLGFAGKPEEGVAAARDAIRRDPFQGDWLYICLGLSLFFARQFEEAIEVMEGLSPMPYWVCMGLICCCAHLDREADTQHWVKELESCAPGDLTFADLYPAELETIRLDADKELYRTGFQKAGLAD